MQRISEIISFKSSSLLLTVVVTVAVCIVYLWGFSSARGTDQFWYLSDTETLIDGKAPLTNTILPGIVLRQNTGNPTVYFIHNGPLLYLNAFLGKLLKQLDIQYPALVAWKTSNLFWLLATAVLTGLCVGKHSGSEWGYAAFSLYLIAPNSIWYAGNILQENFFGFLTGLLLLTLIYRKTLIYAWQIATITLALGYYTHPFFIVIGLFFILYSCLTKRLQYAIASFILLIVALSTKNTLFPSSFQPNFESIISSAVPGVSNSIWQMSDTVNPITFELLVQKFIAAIKYQFFTIKLAGFYVFTNISLIAVGYLTFRQFSKGSRRDYLELTLFSLIVLGAYFALVVLMQNQPRYQQIIAPVVIFNLIVAVASIDGFKKYQRITLPIIVSLVLVAFFLMKTIKTQGQIQNRFATNIAQQLLTQADEPRIAFIGNKSWGKYIAPIYYLKPYKSLPIDTNLLDKHKIEQTLELFDPDLLVSESQDLNYMKHNYSFSTSITGFSESERLFVFKRNTAD